MLLYRDSLLGASQIVFRAAFPIKARRLSGNQRTIYPLSHFHKLLLKQQQTTCTTSGSASMKAYIHLNLVPRVLFPGFGWVREKRLGDEVAFTLQALRVATQFSHMKIPFKVKFVKSDRHDKQCELFNPKTNGEKACRLKVGF